MYKPAICHSWCNYTSLLPLRAFLFTLELSYYYSDTEFCFLSFFFFLGLVFYFSPKVLTSWAMKGICGFKKCSSAFLFPLSAFLGYLVTQGKQSIKHRYYWKVARTTTSNQTTNAAGLRGDTSLLHGGERKGNSTSIWWDRSALKKKKKAEYNGSKCVHFYSHRWEYLYRSDSVLP